MKKTTLLLLAVSLFILPVDAQQDTLQLQEIVVKGARVITKADRTLLFPSSEILQSSTSGYNLIRRLSLPGIRVDEINHTILSTMNDGEVQLRVNDIVVSKAEFMSIDIPSVESIEYIDNPGVRYGEGIAKVINIKTHRAVHGYTLGADLGNALTTLNGSNMAYAKYNHRSNEFSLSYTNNYSHFNDYDHHETAHYLLSSGDTKTITRQSLNPRSTNVTNSLQVIFNQKQENCYQFQAKLTSEIINTPTSRSQKLITEDAAAPYSTLYHSRDKSLQPILDLYYDRQIDSTQALRANAVATYINSDYHYAYDEGQPISYACDGKTYSLTSEAIYENHLRPFTLTAGINYQQKYVSNNYTGSLSTTNRMRFSNTYAFAQLSGNLFSRLNYVAGIGLSYLYFHQEEHRFDYTLLRPKLTLLYPLGNNLKLRYALDLGQHVSQIANTSDVLVRINSMEMEMGNPDLRPNSQINTSLRLSYDIPRLSTFIEVFYRRNGNVNLDKYIRTDDNTFIHSQQNQDQCTMYYALANFNYYIIPEKINIGLDGGLYRFYNFGDDYRHCYTAYNWQAWASAYFGKLSLSAYADNGWNFMEGENEGHSGHNISLSASYSLGNCTLSLTWQQPLESNCKTYTSYVRNHYVSKTIQQYSRDNSNLVYLGFTWNFSRGKQYKGIDKQLNNSDRQTGILKM